MDNEDYSAELKAILDDHARELFDDELEGLQ